MRYAIRADGSPGRVHLWPFRYERRVEWRDLDAAGHVNNAVYLTYMESARTAAYYSIIERQRPEDLDIILARASVDFRSAANLHETLVVEVRPGRVGETSFVLLYTVREKESGRLVAEGESTQVSFDYAAGAKKPIPPRVREALSEGSGSVRI